MHNKREIDKESEPIDLLLRTIIEEKVEENQTRGRIRQMMLDWMMTGGYGKLTEEAQQQEKLRHQKFEPA